MGYNTDFQGSFAVTPAMSEEFRTKLNDFGQERHANDELCPGIWCDWWAPNDSEICHNGGEKFYFYVEWIEYLIKHFFIPEGYTLNGEVRWRGEDFDDVGKIIIKDNVVEVDSTSW